MTTTHGLAILNGLHRFPGVAGFTCFPHRHGASTVDYIMTQPSFIPCIQDFTVGARPMGVAVDHALLTLSVSFQYSTAQTSVGKSHTHYTFTPETDSVYTKEISDHLRTVGPSLSLEECTTLLTETLHSAASVAYPHTRPVRRRQYGSMPQNSWYDEECREMRAQLQRDLLLGVITYRQSQIAFRRLVRRKKRAYLSQLERDLYQMFLSRDSREAWRLFHEHSTPPAITSPDVWDQYATSLYMVPGQEPLPSREEPCPATSTFFTARMVQRAIDRMRTGRAYDHDGLVAEHSIHARDMLMEVLVVLFNRAMCEGLPETWRLSTIVPIFKAGDPMEPGNYRTIMVGHTLARLYVSILEQHLSNWAEGEGMRAKGQAGFRRDLSTLDHILTLRAIIEEGRSHGKRIYCSFVDFRKAFDMVPRARLMRRLQEMGVPIELMWGIMALYKSVVGRVCTPQGLRTSSHQLEIETGRFRGVPADSRICRLGHLEPETELHYICHCTVYYEIRGRFHCLFREGFGPLSRVMSFEDQKCLGLYLLEVHRHRDTLLRRARGRQSQRQITDFFTPNTGQLEEQSVEHLVQSSVHTHTATTGTLID
ncbi:hypothetical protein KP509_04G105200 [Ceratopteris richardii]|uniref:Reverse transcriptase domain-containing protein n=1 Tax=Ceratopteris richardii TaxID=49495 RepID=A0A8T2UW55_CERRI|nr:hypothetical protein KP509_04G105200 [Ceratopteris richardii]